MAVIWQQGEDAEGRWLLYASGEVHMPMIRWRDGDPPERYRHWAAQARKMAEYEREQIARLERWARIHELQVVAYEAVAGALEFGQPGEIVVELRPERPILPRPPEGEA